jgi:hypothetical protein
MFFNLLTLCVPDVTPGCFSIYWLWAYLTLLHDVFQSFDFERTWRYSRMFFNLLTLSVPDVTPECFSICWLSVPDVTPECFSIFWLWAYLTLLQNVFQSFDTERTWRYSGMFFNLLTERTWRYSRTFFNLITLSLPDVTPASFSIFCLQVRSKSKDWKTFWSNVR